MTEIPAKTPRPIGRTANFLPGIEGIRNSRHPRSRRLDRYRGVQGNRRRRVRGHDSCGSRTRCGSRKRRGSRKRSPLSQISQLVERVKIKDSQQDQDQVVTVIYQLRREMESTEASRLSSRCSKEDCTYRRSSGYNRR
jgi:hypothetical protein